MKQIFAVFKKELKRFFTDKRMLAGLILPGILIFVIYSLMGTFLQDMLTADTSAEYIVYVKNQSAQLEVLNTASEMNIKIVNADSVEESEIKRQIKDEEAHLYIEFEENFDQKLSSSLKPNIKMYFNSVSTTSQTVFSYYQSAFSSLMFDPSTIKFNLSSVEDLSTEEDLSKMIITMLLPYLLIVFLITGCLAVATESIAGEKERGTIATLLVTPCKRSHIAIGKILALSVMALVSATSSLFGILLSLPKLMAIEGMEGMTMNVYGFTEIAQLFLVVVFTVILFNVMLSIISTFAKSVKEASSYSSPLMIVVVVIGILSMVTNSSGAMNPLLCLIPIYNSTYSMSAILAGTITPLCIFLTVLSNLAISVIGVILLAKMFNSEKMMFTK